MSLARLLTLGSSLEAGRNHYGRFKPVGLDAVVPRFSRPPVPPTTRSLSKPDADRSETREISNSENPFSEATGKSLCGDSSAESSTEPLLLPQEQFDNTARSEEGGGAFLGRWFRKRIPGSRASRLIEQVRVIRNDLSLADLELVPIEAAGGRRAVSRNGNPDWDEKNLARRVCGLFRSLLPLG